MSFSQLAKTQPAVVAILQRSLLNRRLAHAYVFAGDALSDMETAARELAKAVNCECPTRDGGCGSCKACEQIDATTPPGGLHPDVQWFRPESKSRRIAIDQMRECERSLHLKPSSGRMKVGIIVEADRTTQEAANAFLKTLEEPPASSLILLLTAQPQQLLETVQSRCQRLQFGSSATGEPDPTHAAVVDGLLTLLEADGSVLAAYRLLSIIQQFLGGARERIEGEVEERLQLGRYRDTADDQWRKKMEEELVAQVEAEYRRVRASLFVTLEWVLRDILVIAHGGGEELVFHRARMQKLAGLAPKLTLERALDNVAAIEQLQEHLERNVNEALALEVAALRMCGLTAPQVSVT